MPGKTAETKLEGRSGLVEKATLYPNKAGVHYHEFPTENGSKATLVVVDLDSKNWLIKPSLNTPTTPTSATARKLGAAAAVNGGFFNLSNGESTSYIVIDGKQMCEPKENKALMENPKLQPFLPVILNRSELRFLATKDGELAIDVAFHDSKIPKGMKLISSLQAGPQLLPKLTAKEEAFVRTDPDGKEVDSIGCYKTAARTAFGITGDGHAIIICVSGKKQDEFSSGVTLPYLAQVLKSMGCVKAINFDGGTSSTMVIRTGEDDYKMVLGRHPETLVKSVLSVVPK